MVGLHVVAAGRTSWLKPDWAVLVPQSGRLSVAISDRASQPVGRESSHGMTSQRDGNPAAKFAPKAFRMNHSDAIFSKWVPWGGSEGPTHDEEKARARCGVSR